MLRFCELHIPRWLDASVFPLINVWVCEGAGGRRRARAGAKGRREERRDREGKGGRKGREGGRRGGRERREGGNSETGWKDDCEKC